MESRMVTSESSVMLPPSPPLLPDWAAHTLNAEKMGRTLATARPDPSRAGILTEEIKTESLG